MRKWSFIAVPLLFAITLVPIRAEGFSNLERRAAEGDSVEGLPGSIVEKIFEIRSNRGGLLAFTAEFGSADASSPTPRRLGIVLQDQGAPRLAADLTALEQDDPSLSFLYYFSVNRHATVAVVSEIAGVYLFPRFGPALGVLQGDVAPVQPSGTTFSSFVGQSDGFLGQEDEMFFLSVLSDGRKGLFGFSSSGVRRVALEGEPVPDRPGAAIGPILRGFRTVGGRIAFAAGGDVFVADGLNVRSVAAHDQLLPTGDAFSRADGIDINSSGEVLIASVSGQRPQLTLFTEAGAISVYDDSVRLEGIGEEPVFLSDSVYLDDSHRVWFGVANNSRGGIFGWRDGNVTKIAADGDRSPAGNILYVSSQLTTFPGPPPPFFSYVYFPRPDAMGNVAFEAVDSGLGHGRFQWRDGRVEPIDFRSQDGGDRLLLSLWLVGPDGDGTILAIGTLCCGALSKGIYNAAPAGSRPLVLPYVAAGGSRETLLIHTQVEISNTSPYPAHTELTVFSRPGPLFNPLQDGPRLEAGDFARIDSRSEGPLGRGFSLVESAGGGFINANAAIRLERGGSLISQVGLAASDRVRQGSVLVDQSGSADTGLAVFNPGMSPLDLEVRLLDDGGTQVGQETVHLEAGEQVSGFVSEMFPAARGPDFLGSLRIESLTEAGFVAAGLRQAGLLLSALPLRTATSLPGRGLSTFFPKSAERILTNENGAVAISAGSAIRVVTRQQSVPVLNKDTVLPGGVQQSSDSPQVRLIDWNADMALLFTARLEDNRVGMYVWSAGEIQQVLADGQEVHGFPVALDADGEAASRNQAGIIAAGGRQVVVFDPAPRLLVTSDSPIESSGGEDWGLFRQVVVDSAGDVYFRTDRAIGRASGSGIDLVARVGGPLEGTSLRPDRFLQIRLDPDGDLLLGFSGLFGLTTLNAIARYSGGSFEPVWFPNMGIQGLPGFGARQIDAFGFRVNAAGEVLVNGLAYEVAGERFVQVFVRVPRGGVPTLFVLESGNDLTGVPPGAEFHFASHIGDTFWWSDDGVLLFQALDRHGEIAAFMASARQVVRIVGLGDAFSRGPDGQMLQVSEVGSVAGFGPKGVPLVNSLYLNGDGESSDALLEAAGAGGQERFLPIVASGQFAGTRFESRLLVSNHGDSEATIELTPTTSDGLTLATRELRLPPGAVATPDLELEDGFLGWMRVRTFGGSTSAQERLSIYRGSALVAEATVPESGLRTKGMIDTRFATAAHTGLAVANPWNGPVAVHFTLDTGDPATTRTQRISLDGREQRSIFVSELFPPIFVSASVQDPGFPVEGILRIDSTAPVAMIALRQEGIVMTTQGIE